MNDLVTIHKHYQMGEAPYRFLGVWSAPSASLAEQNPNAYNNAMASRPACCRLTCDHCGAPIMNHYIIRDMKGNKFSVGSSCIDKIDDVENTSKVDAARKAHEKKLRQARAEKKREDERTAREAELQAQRDRNNGLTDWELNQQQQRTAHEAELEAKREKLAYFINALDEGNNFEGELRDNLMSGHLPYGRGQTIMLEIIAKKAGRKNSKAYNVKYDEAEAQLNKVNSAQ